ncbi:MAG: hypothetical protein GY827_08585 [Cytophagales bacterium]|nr:hypothetical protein [Cytophagales bacterium]
MMTKFLKVTLTITFLMVAWFGIAQNKKQTVKEIEGILIEKGWSKSTQSYCAQGSEYLVLQLDNGREIVLAYKEGYLKTLSQYKGKKVKLKGEYELKVIDHSDNDDGSQRPVGDSFACTIFRVKQVIQ